MDSSLGASRLHRYKPFWPQYWNFACIPRKLGANTTYFFLVRKLFFLFGKLLSLFGKLFSLFVNFSLVGKIVAQFVFLDFYVPFSPFSVRYIYFYLEFDQNKKSFCERPPLSFNKSFPLAGLEILLLSLWRFPPLLLRLPCQVQLHLLILESFQAEEREEKTKFCCVKSAMKVLLCKKRYRNHNQLNILDYFIYYGERKGWQSFLVENVRIHRK